MSKSLVIAVLLSLAVGAGVMRLAETQTASPQESFGPVTEESQRRCAYHEAGHAVVAAILRPMYPVTDVFIRTDVLSGNTYGTTNHLDVNRFETVEDLMAEGVENLAGRQAEIAILGQPTNAGTFDLKEANELFTTMCTKSGLCGSLLVEPIPSLESLAKIDRCLKLSQERADVLVRANAATIRELGELILAQPTQFRKRMLTAEQLQAFFRGHRLVNEVEAGCPMPTTCP